MNLQKKLKKNDIIRKKEFFYPPFLCEKKIRQTALLDVVLRQNGRHSKKNACQNVCFYAN